MMTRKCLGSASYYVRRIDVSRDLQDRIETACRRRERDEALPSSAMGATIGSLLLALAIAAVVTSVSLGTLYASFASLLAAVLTFAYLRLQIARAKRYASLDVRDSIAVALSVCVDAHCDRDRDAAPVVAFRSRACTALDDQRRRHSLSRKSRGGNAGLPSRRRPDRRTLRRRSLARGPHVAFAGLAAASGAVFEAFSGTPFFDLASSASVLFGFFACYVIMYRLNVLRRKPPSETERSALSHVAI